MVCSVTYDDGSTLSKDHDGVLVISPDLYLLQIPPTSRREPQHLTDSVSYYDGSTTSKDHDGLLAVSDTPERLASQNLDLTYVLPRTLLWTALYDDGVTQSKDHDGLLVVDQDTPYPPLLSVLGKVPQLLSDTPSFYDGVTISKDKDGELVINGGELTERVSTNQERYILAPSASVTGEATASSDSSEQINSASASVAGDATASGDNVVYRAMSASVTGAASATATATIIHEIEGLCEDDFTAFGTLTESPGPSPVVVPSTLPGQARTYFGEGLSPSDGMIVAQRGDASVNNKLVPASASNFSLSGSYSGPAYSLGGPFSTSPVRLGFRRGDRLKLWGPVGNEPNHGREFTLDEPNGFAVVEEVNLPDTTAYEFMAFRRLS